MEKSCNKWLIGQLAKPNRNNDDNVNNDADNNKNVTNIKLMMMMMTRIKTIAQQGQLKQHQYE